MALEPKMIHGKVQPLRQPICSMVNQANVSRASEYPPATRTKELVHIFLFRGNSRDQRYPTARLESEAMARPAVFVETDLLERRKSPVRTPINAVPMAGRSLSRPSGSRTL